MYCFGVDIGGTTVKMGLFEGDGNVIDKWEIKTVTANGGEAVLPDIAASIAEKLGFDYFTTTLSLSPHKNSNWINEIGKRTEEDLNTTFLYSDFKKENGYKRSIELSKIYDLYRQDYCGCIYSKK